VVLKFVDVFHLLVLHHYVKIVIKAYVQISMEKQNVFVLMALTITLSVQGVIELTVLVGGVFLKTTKLNASARTKKMMCLKLFIQNALAPWTVEKMESVEESCRKVVKFAFAVMEKLHIQIVLQNPLTAVIVITATQNLNLSFIMGNASVFAPILIYYTPNVKSLSVVKKQRLHVRLMERFVLFLREKKSVCVKF